MKYNVPVIFFFFLENIYILFFTTTEYFGLGHETGGRGGGNGKFPRERWLGALSAPLKNSFLQNGVFCRRPVNGQRLSRRFRRTKCRPSS